MDRAKVICHMMTTIDGKVVFDEYENEDFQTAGNEYDRILFSTGQAYGCGRATFQTDHVVDLSPFKGASVTYTDKIIFPKDGQFLCVAFDRFGKLRYKDNIMRYSGHNSLILEVLTEQVPPEVLAYYDSLSIPYIFCGSTEFDPLLFLQKIKKLYHIDTFMLCGGPEINAVFLRADLVDEISIVIGPAVEGSRMALTPFGSEVVNGLPKFFHLKVAQPLPGNAVLIHYIK